MNFIATAADRLLSAIVPRANAAALTCSAGCTRVTCTCAGGYWYDACVKSSGVLCETCTKTVWTC